MIYKDDNFCLDLSNVIGYFAGPSAFTLYTSSGKLQFDNNYKDNYKLLDAVKEYLAVNECPTVVTQSVKDKQLTDWSKKRGVTTEACASYLKQIFDTNVRVMTDYDVGAIKELIAFYEKNKK